MLSMIMVATTASSRQQTLVVILRLERDFLARTNSGGLQALPHHHIAPGRGDGVVALVGRRLRAVGEGRGKLVLCSCRQLQEAK